MFSILNTSSRGPAIYNKNIIINKPNTWVPGENLIGMNKEGNFIIKKGSSVSTILVTGFLSLILSDENFNNNINFTQKYLKNNFNMIMNIRDSNISSPNINANEITSGIFNPHGLLNLLLDRLQEYENLNKNYHTNKKYYDALLKGGDKLNFYKNAINSSDSLDKKRFDNENYNSVENKNIHLFNNILDFSLKFHSNYTISSRTKLKNNKQLYSTKQPELVSLLFYQVNLDLSSENILKLNNEIEILKSNRKSDIIQCLKVLLTLVLVFKYNNFRLNITMRISYY